MPPHNPEKPFGESFRADNDTQAGILSQFVEFSTAEPALTAAQLLEGIREAMSPMQLVHPDVVKKLPIYQKIRLFLERFNIDTPITEESGNLVARRLICRIWNSDVFARERHLALQAFDSIRNGIQIPSASSPIGSASIMQDVFGLPRNEGGSTSNDRNNHSSQSNMRSLASTISKRFSSESSKFSGESEEDLDKFLDSYARAARELDLTAEQKVKFFHHLLRDHALVFYRDSIEDKVHNWGEILRTMTEEFNSEVRMESIADHLRALHITQYETDDRSEPQALRALAKDIQLLTPQAPRECRTDRHRRMTLQDATRGRSWALQVVSSSHSKKLSYQQLLHELENSLQQYTAHKTLDGKPESDAVPYRKGRLAEVHFAGQGRYGRPPGKATAKQRPPPSPTPEICWNCEKSGCSVRKCSLPKNHDRIRKNRIKFYEARKGLKLDRRTKETLFEFSYLMDVPDSDNDSDASASSTEDAQREEDQKMAEVHHALIHTRFEHGSKGLSELSEDPGETDF